MSKYHLKNGIYVYSDRQHSFGTDAVLLADFARPDKRLKSVDLGTGCGIIPLIWRATGVESPVFGIDISKSAIMLCEQSQSVNPKSMAVSFLRADLKMLKGVLPFGEFGLVTMNPPYKPSNDGVISPDPEKSARNHELLCTADDICLAASRLLRFGGRFAVCQRPERICDIFESMRRHRIEPKRLRLVQQRLSSRPSLALIEGRFGGKSGLTAEPVLFIEAPDGSPSAEMTAILNSCYETEEKS